MGTLDGGARIYVLVSARSLYRRRRGGGDSENMVLKINVDPIDGGRRRLHSRSTVISPFIPNG